MPESSPALLVHPMPGRRTAFAGLWLTRGAAHDPSDLAGATHLIEHLTLRRCGDRDRIALARLVDRLGGEVDAWTSADAMALTARTTCEALPEALDLLADALLEPTFAPADVELERRVTLAEMEMVRDDPVEQVSEAILHAAWGDHPLARPVIGSAETVAAMTPATLARHHRQLVAPGRVVAAVAGDVTPADLEPWVRRLGLARPPATPPLPPLRWRDGQRTIARDGIDQVHVRLAFPAPAAGNPVEQVVVVLNRVLGVGVSSRLFQRVREEEGLAYEIWSAATLYREGGLVEVGWTCSTDAFAAAWRVVAEELDRFERTLSEDDVAVAREGLLRGLEMDLEAPAGRAGLDVAEVLERGRRFDPAAARAELAAVSPEAVRRLAARVLDRRRAASAVCAPSGFAVRVA